MYFTPRLQKPFLTNATLTRRLKYPKLKLLMVHIYTFSEVRLCINSLCRENLIINTKIIENGRYDVFSTCHTQPAVWFKFCLTFETCPTQEDLMQETAHLRLGALTMENVSYSAGKGLLVSLVTEFTQSVFVSYFKSQTLATYSFSSFYRASNNI